MASRKSKVDLLVKVRYQNPLPPPPCPPKFIDIPTDPRRYARPEFLDAIANDAPLPMIVDAECGMPLDLGQWEALWGDSASDAALNPDSQHRPVLDPRDQALLLDPSSSSSHTNGDAPRPSLRGVPATPSNVTWLRKTEYLSRDTAALSRTPTAEAPLRDERPDVSRDAQLRSIATSFTHANDAFDLSTLRHPTKRGVHAEASFEILPDVSIWANEYDLFRFSERPGERGPEMGFLTKHAIAGMQLDDPRLDCAIMRPMASDGEHFLAYYLAPTDTDAEVHRDARADPSGLALQTSDDDAVAFNFVRDYEVVKVEQEVPGEFLLVLDDGGAGVDVPRADGGTERRTPGAYYKNIERKMLLKKKRTEPIERFHNKWSSIRIHHSPPSAEEAQERTDMLAEVLDPEYLHADAEGDPDDEAFGTGALEGEMQGGAGMQVDVEV
ncbi:RNA polymerase II-associated [Vararia minispora EC-137]|uniref:RNA polymerase II-associated n=1 Tax=Vararia minispora EC-137 TaxID=1314806 RepID=A0ACB8QUZ4_9AGAM|nr:RNA polymerase II-associated [Vararia minispora EC-137]